MTDFNLSITHGETKITFSMKEGSDKVVQDSLQKVFDLLQPRLMVAASDTQVNPFVAEKSIEATAEETPPVRNDFAVSIAERVAPTLDEQIEQSHHITGIKIGSDGVKRYRCKVYCQNKQCKQQSLRYIPKEDNVVSCRKCESLHIVELAAAVEGERDASGKFYFARKLVSDHAQ